MPTEVKQKLPLADLEEEHLYHWEIDFEIKVDKANLDLTDPEIKTQADLTTDTYIWIADSLTVRSGEDAEQAVTKAKRHVLNEDQSGDYELPCIGFKLTGIKLSSTADI